ncbi:hypothetical protein B296_00013861 [Ensete ventricosum]|uniref:Uncharacterized protein n=1 Tax=Ensete ventricosum TaxID=4639 RepID=A0A426YZD5_ENSVE|nr:hypothetical protein B296_00013861 [Ensete ventricosum]
MPFYSVLVLRVCICILHLLGPFLRPMLSLRESKPCDTLAYQSVKVSLPRDLLESLRLTKEKTGQKKQFPRGPQATAQANTSYSHMQITSMDITNSERF